MYVQLFLLIKSKNNHTRILHFSAFTVYWPSSAKQQREMTKLRIVNHQSQKQLKTIIIKFSTSDNAFLVL